MLCYVISCLASICHVRSSDKGKGRMKKETIVLGTSSTSIRELWLYTPLLLCILKVTITLKNLPCTATLPPLPILLVVQSCPLRYVQCERDGNSRAADNKMLNLRSTDAMLCCAVCCVVMCATVRCIAPPYVLCAGLSSITPSLLLRHSPSPHNCYITIHSTYSVVSRLIITTPHDAVHEVREHVSMRGNSSSCPREGSGGGAGTSPTLFTY